jgi:hypothetical protein
MDIQWLIDGFLILAVVGMFFGQRAINRMHYNHINALITVVRGLTKK